MSALNIRDLSFVEELDSCESKIAGAASAGAAAAANYNDATAASGSTTNGDVYANAEGSYYGYYYSGGPRSTVNAYDRYYYYY